MQASSAAPKKKILKIKRSNSKSTLISSSTPGGLSSNAPSVPSVKYTETLPPNLSVPQLASLLSKMEVSAKTPKLPSRNKDAHFNDHRRSSQPEYSKTIKIDAGKTMDSAKSRSLLRNSVDLSKKDAMKIKKITKMLGSQESTKRL